MAASSSSSSSPASSMSLLPPSSPPSSHSSLYVGEWEYDVFLCFRGDDTRFGFTSHLLKALSNKQIKTFIDNKLEKTESIDKLISILQRSALSVVVFSEKFADSIWCLEEVVTIARRMVEFGHRVLPVFWKVDPSDVTNDSGSYATIIDREYKGTSTYSEDKKRWMDALKAVANCAGHTSQDTKIESELIEVIVEDVQKRLIDMSPSIKSANLVGMGSRILEVERLSAMDTLDDTRIIGLWGMGGVGKTTLAEACYKRIISSNKGIKYCFIGSIAEKCGKWHGVEGIVNKLYSSLLSENIIDRQDLDISYRRGRLSRSRVFIVLDDVETPSQLEQILLGDVIMNPAELFAQGSRIIVTTRDKRVLDYAKAMIYNVAGLNDIESIELFSLRAFRQHQPPHDWVDLSRLAASYCRGNPLALTILGGTLFGQDQHYWRSFLSELKLIQNLNVHDILSKSYDKLGAEEKKIFLDVACLLCEISRSQLIGYMATMYQSAYAKVKDLIDRCLLTCVSGEIGEKIVVHDLLKEMAWNIVNEEPKLHKRSRLADADDIHKLLTTREVKYWPTLLLNPFKVGETFLRRRKKRKVVDKDWKGYNPLEEHRTTEGISLELCTAKEMYLEADAFDGMNFLTFLKIWYVVYDEKNNKIHLPYGGLNSLPDGLRWLEWDEYPAKSLPSKFRPQHLVHLILRYSPIRRCWEGYDQPQLVNLMVLNLFWCQNLIAIPNISCSSNLEELRLCGCESLVEVPSYVQYLTKLITLNLNNCKNLKRLPRKLDSKLLKHVRMSNCVKVTYCPEINSRELVWLDLDGISLVKLPNAIYNVKKDGVLRLYGKNITKFPAITTSLEKYKLGHTSIREMDLHDYHHHQGSSDLVLPRFGELNLYENSQLKSLPESVWNMVSDSLVIDGSPLIESLPEISEPVNGLTYIGISNCGGLKSLPSNLGNINSLYLSETGITSLPSSIQEWQQLTFIKLCCCKSLVSIPSGIHKLSKLSYLYLRGCVSIRSLPELPQNLKELDYNLLCSRSELPDWFTYKRENPKMAEDCIVKVELPLLKHSDQPMIKGIAFGIVGFLQPDYMKCECKVGTTTVASWSFSIRVYRESLSEKLWLAFDNNLEGNSHCKGEGDEAWDKEFWDAELQDKTIMSLKIIITDLVDKTILRIHMSPHVSSVEIDGLLQETGPSIVDEELRVESAPAVEMPGLLQILGRSIVDEELRVEKRSRLWKTKDICNLFKQNKGSEYTEGILWNPSTDELEVEDIHMQSDAFAKFDNLWFLDIRYDSGDQKCLPKLILPPEDGLSCLPKALRILRWDSYPARCLPPEFCPGNLTSLVLRHSKIEQLWEGRCDVRNLELLDLEGSIHLKEFPDLSIYYTFLHDDCFTDGVSCLPRAALRVECRSPNANGVGKGTFLSYCYCLSSYDNKEDPSKPRGYLLVWYDWDVMRKEIMNVGTAKFKFRATYEGYSKQGGKVQIPILITSCGVTGDHWKAWVAFCRTPSKPDYKVDRKPHISKFVRQLQSNFLNNASFFFFFFFSSSSRGSSHHIFAKSANDIMVPSRTWTKSNGR
ncbi:Disease resistance-like protein DSC1 [Linum perenne]